MVNSQPYTYVYTRTTLHVLTPTHVSTHMHIYVADSLY